MPRPADRSQSRDQDVTHPSKAIELFTNREGAIEAFERHINAPEGSILPVLHFYGVGGSGKSWLFEKLKQTAGDLDPPVPCATVDFHHEREVALDGPHCRALARDDAGFASLRADPRFQVLVGEPT